MIIWLASYPKSGNTWLRAFLSTYLNLNNNNPFESMKAIERFPNINQFKDIVNINELIKNQLEICKHWITAQEIINLKQETTFLKTHNVCGIINQYQFTNSKNTSGLIYIVRDPRSVAVSYAYHNNINFDKAIDKLINQNMVGHNSKYITEFRASWRIHYLSWEKSLYPKIIIKYEDLHSDTYINFLKVLNFIKKFKNIEINEKKIKDSIFKCEFVKLSKLEKSLGFKEKENGFFFRSGKTDEWKIKLNKQQIKKIENAFFNEMKELKYL